MTLTPEFTQYATTEEAYDAIQRLQESDFRKLMIIARSFTRKRRLNAHASPHFASIRSRRKPRDTPAVP